MPQSSLEDIPELGKGKDRPKVNPSVDVSKLSLTPTEAFVLSRIDGRATYDEIVRISPLGRDQTIGILRKLRKESVILGPGDNSAGNPAERKSRLPRRVPPTIRGVTTPAPVVVTDEMLRKAQEKDGKVEEKHTLQKPLLERLDDGSWVSAADLSDGSDLPEETKKRIVRLHRRLRKLLPHQLLGLPEDADAASIKHAFAEASKELHPDRYFGKAIGSYREKLAQIFARVSEAMQELEKRRREKKG